jgi:hypothetical protein
LIDPTLPPQLEARIAALERQSTADFDARCWMWMVLLGVLVPVLLILIGWFAT